MTCGELRQKQTGQMSNLMIDICKIAKKRWKKVRMVTANK